ncbi:MAG: hypothetical protein WDW38_002981 [Sanguina aurantia]
MTADEIYVVRQIVHPVLQAEWDLRYLNWQRKEQEKEAEIMKDASTSERAFAAQASNEETYALFAKDADRAHVKWPQVLNAPLLDVDPELYDIIEREKNRQYKGLELIPSENFVSASVMEAVGSIMTNKYSEGYPGARYYGGNEFIDMAERLCQERALKAFRLDPNEWAVNVQPLSGSPSNFQVYFALLQPGDTILGMSLAHGGHLTHGAKVNFSGKIFNAVQYGVNEQGLIDYDEVERLAVEHKPKMVVAGYSAYSQLMDWARFRAIADKVGAILFVDMAHIAGLVAAGVYPSPLQHAHVVTSTTHKTLRGPRGGIIVSTIAGMGEASDEIQKKLQSVVFPGIQGGPLMHVIAAKAVAFKEALEPEFKTYQAQVIKNAKAMASTFIERGYKIVSGGTENHLMLLDLIGRDVTGKAAEEALGKAHITVNKALANAMAARGATLVSGGTSNHIVLVDLRPKGIDGSRVERILEVAHIAANKNTVPGDVSAMVPGGLRMGSPALTSRGFVEKDFVKVAEFVDRAITLSIDHQKNVNGKLKDFRDAINKELPAGVVQLKKEVEEFSSQFPTIGFEKSTMRYTQ